MHRIFAINHVLVNQNLLMALVLEITVYCNSWQNSLPHVGVVGGGDENLVTKEKVRLIFLQTLFSHFLLM